MSSVYINLLQHLLVRRCAKKLGLFGVDGFSVMGLLNVVGQLQVRITKPLMFSAVVSRSTNRLALSKSMVILKSCRES
jgi:hypothetical protein